MVGIKLYLLDSPSLAELEKIDGAILFNFPNVSAWLIVFVELVMIKPLSLPGPLVACRVVLILDYFQDFNPETRSDTLANFLQLVGFDHLNSFVELPEKTGINLDLVRQLKMFFCIHSFNSLRF